MTARKFTPISGFQRIFETGLIVLSVGALFLLLALLTYHPSDPGWSQTAWGGKIHNAAGSAGAWVADLTFFVFGVFAYLIPPLLVLLGWSLFWRPYRLLEVDYLALGLRILGFLVLFLGLSALGSMNFNDIHNFSSGGLIGDMVSSSMKPMFGELGTTLVLLCCIATGITLFTGWSWIMIVEKMGECVTGSGHFVVTLPTRMAGWFARKAGYAPVDRVGDELLDDDEDELSFSTEPLPSAAGSDAPLIKTPRFSIHRRSEPSGVTPESTPAAPSLPTEGVRRQEPSFSFVTEAVQTAAPVASNPARVATISALDDEDDEELELPWESAPAPQVTAPVAMPAAAPVAMPTPLQAAIAAIKPKPAPEGDLPSINLLNTPPVKTQVMSSEELERIARLVEAKLADYNVQARVVGVFPGPVITRFELDLAPGMKASKITSLARDLARSLSAVSVRVVEVIPGKPYVGIELPNAKRQTVYMKEVLDCDRFRNAESPLTMVLGQDIAGEPVVVNLAKMPHLLVAGTTGSGKSVGVNVMILSMLYKATPEELRFIMIDPKMLELSVYEGIPHLLTEVVTDMKDAANALRWCVGEMERRYKLMSVMGVRNLKGYNVKVGAAIESGNPIKDPFWKPGDSFDAEAPDLEKLPQIVVVIDEFADMMMIVGKKVEELIARIAQKARAAGIHLILATQRPSVDVITGLIKANIPTRISFQVSSKIDSRTILDQQGAESLLGMGDMLYLPAGDSNPTRVHGAFVDDDEVHKVVADWKLRGEPNYIEEILSGEMTADTLLPGEQAEGGDDELDALFDEAVAFVVESRRGSTSSVQRRFKIGYNRAARLIDQMELHGIVSPPGSNGQRDVLAPAPMRD
ncbi:MAG: DNA translocase FtsK 4TM domain-containing protein [Aeromonadaceae bacterium]